MTTPTNKPLDVEKEIDEILTANFATKPDGGAWCTRHAHKLDVGVCVSCKAKKELLALLQTICLEVIDVCRQEYIANANTPIKERLNSSQMTMKIQEKQRQKLNSLLGGGDE